MPGKARGDGKPFEKGDARAGRPPGSRNKATIEVQQIARGLLSDKKYQAGLRKRLRDGSIAPAVENTLWHYAYGKPKDRVEIAGPDGEPLRITYDDVRQKLTALANRAANAGSSPPGDKD